MSGTNNDIKKLIALYKDYTSNMCSIDLVELQNIVMSMNMYAPSEVGVVLADAISIVLNYHYCDFSAFDLLSFQKTIDKSEPSIINTAAAIAVRIIFAQAPEMVDAFRRSVLNKVRDAEMQTIMDEFERPCLPLHDRASANGGEGR
jgi:hypothetical protein